MIFSQWELGILPLLRTYSYDYKLIPLGLIWRLTYNTNFYVLMRKSVHSNFAECINIKKNE